MMTDLETFTIVLQRAKDNGFKGFEENPSAEWWTEHRGRRYLMLLFSHEFAEKYFGDKFKHKIQQAVIDKNPLAYYYNNHEPKDAT